MLPTFDFANTARVAGQLVLKAFGSRLGKFLILVGAISVAVSTFGPSYLVSTWMPQIPTLSEYFSTANLNSDILNLCGYSVAADLAVSSIDNFISFINWIFRSAVLAFVTCITAYFAYQLFAKGYSDLKDVTG